VRRSSGTAGGAGEPKGVRENTHNGIEIQRKGVGHATLFPEIGNSDVFYD
jgi:hypothetical protein